MLKEALIGPIAVAPYTIVTRKPYKSNQSKQSASTKLWLIKANE